MYVDRKRFHAVMYKHKLKQNRHNMKYNENDKLFVPSVSIAKSMA